MIFRTGGYAMPLAKIHVVEGRYDEARIAKVSGAIQGRMIPAGFSAGPSNLFARIKNKVLHRG
jgi:hypothetical protein